MTTIMVTTTRVMEMTRAAHAAPVNSSFSRDQAMPCLFMMALRWVSYST